MKIEYKYVTGETVEVEVSEEWSKILIELDREEYNNNQTETRRHESYEDEGEWAVDNYSDIDTAMERKELTRKYEKTMGKMTDKQMHVIENVFMESMSKAEYAEKFGISRQAVSERVKCIRKKIKKTF